MSRWVLIAGPKGSEKSERALDLANALRKEGVKVGGFLQARQVAEDLGKRYDLLRLSSGERVPLAGDASFASEGDDVPFCSLRFRPSTFERARNWLREDSSESQVLFIGDVSKVEVAGDGHFQAIREALSLPPEKLVVISVRADQLFYIVEKFGLKNDALACLELPADEATIDEFQRRIIEGL